MKQDVEENNPYVHMSYSLLHAIFWRVGAYSDRVAKSGWVYEAFSEWINHLLIDFKAKYGALTPTMLFPANDRVFTVLGHGEVMLGFKVVQQSAEKKEKAKR